MEDKSIIIRVGPISLLVILMLISLIGFFYSWIFQPKELKEEMPKWKWVIIAEIIFVTWRGVLYKKIDLEDLLLLILSNLTLLGVRLFFKYKKQIAEKAVELKNYLNCLYIKSIKLVESPETRKKLIFARAHSCSSSLLQWGSVWRKELVNKEKSKKIWELLTNSPDGIDNFYVKNFGSGSMNHLTEKMLEATIKQLKELMRRTKKIEKFIKEELEKGTKFEGEFDENFPRYVKSEEEKRKYYEIRRKILNYN